MTIVESIKDQWRQVKEKPRKERWEYLWDYYKWHAIIFLLVIAILTQCVISMVNHKDAVFTGYILNCSVAGKDEDFLNGFYEYAGINADKEEAAIYTDLTLYDGQSKKNAETFHRIMAGVAIQDADFVVGQPDAFRPCAYHTSKIMVDLREFLDAETLEKLSDRLYYIDGAVLDQLIKPVGESVGPVIYPNPRKPEIMDDPIPVGIDISDRAALRDSYYYTTEDTVDDTVVYIGIIANTARPELARQFIDYLFS